MEGNASHCARRRNGGACQCRTWIVGLVCLFALAAPFTLQADDPSSLRTFAKRFSAPDNLFAPGEPELDPHQIASWRYKTVPPERTAPNNVATARGAQPRPTSSGVVHLSQSPPPALSQSKPITVRVAAAPTNEPARTIALPPVTLSPAPSGDATAAEPPGKVVLQDNFPAEVPPMPASSAVAAVRRPVKTGTEISGALPAASAPIKSLPEVPPAPLAAVTTSPAIRDVPPFVPVPPPAFVRSTFQVAAASSEPTPDEPPVRSRRIRLAPAPSEMAHAGVSPPPSAAGGAPRVRSVPAVSRESTPHPTNQRALAVSLPAAPSSRDFGPATPPAPITIPSPNDIAMAPVFEDTTEPVVMAPPIRFSPSVENYNPAPAPAVCENSACEPITMRIEGPQVFASAPEPMRIDAVALAAAEQPIPPPAPPVDGSSAGAPSGSPGSFAQVEKLGDAPKSTTLEFLRTQAVLLNPGQCQFDWGLTYSVLDTRFTLPVVDGNGNVVNTANARERLRLLTIPLAVRYGIANGVQGYLNLPVGWSNTELTTDFGDSITNNFGGLGDMSGGLSYHLCKACGPYIPDIIGTLGFVAPTGHASFATSLLTPSSTLGQGFWQLTGNLLFVHTMDPLVLYYGGGYVHRFNASFGPNDVDPGEELDYLMGVGFAVNPFVTISGSLIGGYITTYKVNDTFIPGSDRDPMRFRVSVTVVKGEHICEPFGEIGMTPDSPSRVGVVFTY